LGPRSLILLAHLKKQGTESHFKPDPRVDVQCLEKEMIKLLEKGGLSLKDTERSLGRREHTQNLLLKMSLQMKMQKGRNLKLRTWSKILINISLFKFFLVKKLIY
jgi:hypothetical protein